MRAPQDEYDLDCTIQQRLVIHSGAKSSDGATVAQSRLRQLS